MTSDHYATLVCWSEDDDAFLATCPRLDGCVAHGDTKQEAIDNLTEVVEEWLDAAEEHGWSVPEADTAHQIARGQKAAAEEAARQFSEAVQSTVNTALAEVIPQITKQLMSEIESKQRAALEPASEEYAFWPFIQSHRIDKFGVGLMTEVTERESVARPRAEAVGVFH